MNSKSTALNTLLIILGLVGCAVSPPKTKVEVLSSTEEKIFNLEEEIRTQKTELNKLHLTVDLLSKKLSGSESQATSSHRLKTGRKVASIEKKLPVTKLKPGGAEVSPAHSDETETVADSSQGMMHYYFQGLELISQKKYDEALQLLRNFVIQNPKHVYADRAQYLIGNAHLQNKDYGLVIVATNLLEARYPYSLKIPDALFERGVAFIEMHQRDMARVTLQNLVRRYPKDHLADKAQKKLLELKS